MLTIGEAYTITHLNVKLLIKKSEVCPICLSDFADNKSMVVPECGHSIHIECFRSLLSYNLIDCSICQKPVINNRSDNVSDMPRPTDADNISDYEKVILGDGSGMSPWG